MKIRTILFLIITIVGFQQNECRAQEKKEAHALKEDFSIYRDIAVELAPKLTEMEKEKIYQAFNKRMDELGGQSLTVMGFFKFMMGFETGVKNDEHAEMTLPEEVFMPFLVESRLFPVPIKIIGDQIIVNSTETDLPYGGIIQSINNIPIDTLVGMLSREKTNTFSKVRMERQFSLFYLLKMGSSEAFVVEYKTSLKSDAILSKKINGVRIERYMELMKNKVYPLNREDTEKQLVTSFLEDSKTVYFQFNSFTWRDEKGSQYKTFKKEFNELFNAIEAKGIENLIIDLRHNGGGNVKIPALLYSYLATEAFKETITLQMPDVDFPQKNHIIALDGKKVNKPKEIEVFVKEIKMMLKEKEGKYIGVLRNEKLVKPQKNAFKGKVFLLIGGRSFSASTYFSALYKAQNRGEIVGEQMGGSHHDITAGRSITYTLPNTGITITTPVMVVRFSKELYEKVPEQKINPTIELSIEDAYESFLKQEDGELEKVLKLLKS